MGYKQGSYYTIEFLGTKYRACLPDARMGRDLAMRPISHHVSCFNPRARMGRDIHLIIHVKYTRFLNAFAHHLALSTRYIQFSKNALK